MTSDPNVTYKEKFRALTIKLGHVPTCWDKEWLELQEEYKRAWAPAEETVLAPSTQVRAREPVPDLMAALEASLAAVKAERALSGPDKPSEPERAESSPEPPANNPGPPDGLIEGDRGPGGGLMCKCQACGRLWERPRSKGRPAYRCETCRN